MEVDVVNDLVRNTAVVLQDVEVLGTGDFGDLLCNGLFEYIVSFAFICNSAYTQEWFSLCGGASPQGPPGLTPAGKIKNPQVYI